MKAFRNIAGQVVEITVDLDLEGNPILPPDTTIDPRPEALEEHYVTVVGSGWVQIHSPVVEVTLTQLKEQALKRLSVWRNWILEQPIEHDSVMFDADETARARLTQAVLLSSVGAPVPPAWVTLDNGLHPIADYDALKNLAIVMASEFSSRFFQAADLRDDIETAETKEALALVLIPTSDYAF